MLVLYFVCTTFYCLNFVLQDIRTSSELLELLWVIYFSVDEIVVCSMYSYIQDTQVNKTDWSIFLIAFSVYVICKISVLLQWPTHIFW